MSFLTRLNCYRCEFLLAPKYITDGKDVWHIGSLLIIRCELPILVHLHPRSRKIETISIRGTACSIEHSIEDLGSFLWFKSIRATPSVSMRIRDTMTNHYVY